MSESVAIAVIVIFDVALLGFLAWMMSHPRHLTPHLPARADTAPVQRPRFTRDAEAASEAPIVVELDRPLVGARA